MGFLRRFHTKPRPSEVERSSSHGSCAHSNLQPRWDRPEDIGIPQKASSCVCDSCEAVFTASEAQVVRESEAARLRELSSEADRLKHDSSRTEAINAKVSRGEKSVSVQVATYCRNLERLGLVAEPPSNLSDLSTKLGLNRGPRPEPIRVQPGPISSIKLHSYEDEDSFYLETQFFVRDPRLPERLKDANSPWFMFWKHLFGIDLEVSKKPPSMGDQRGRWRGQDAGQGVIKRLNEDQSLSRLIELGWSVGIKQKPRAWVIVAGGWWQPNRQQWSALTALAQCLLSTTLEVSEAEVLRSRFSSDANGLSARVADYCRNLERLGLTAEPPANMSSLATRGIASGPNPELIRVRPGPVSSIKLEREYYDTNTFFWTEFRVDDPRVPEQFIDERRSRFLPWERELEVHFEVTRMPPLVGSKRGEWVGHDAWTGLIDRLREDKALLQLVDADWKIRIAAEKRQWVISAGGWRQPNRQQWSVLTALAQRLLSATLTIETNSRRVG